MSTANEKVLDARLNERALAQLLKENTRFLKAKAYQALGRPVDQSDDEWSVSVIAFHEAVEKYDPGKGTFHSFAGLLVKRRLWDHERAQRRQEQWVVTSRDAVIDPEEAQPAQKASALEVQAGEAAYSWTSDYAPIPGNTPIRDEIEAIQAILNRYGFSFSDLVEASPKAQKTKTVCGQAAKVLLGDESLMVRMRRTRSLPVSELKAAQLPRKTLERHRRYIIAVTEILSGEYPYLREYVKSILPEEEDQ